MSKNIVIQEGGIGKQMTVNKLKTDKAGGGSVLWMPEDEVSLGTKSISANGTYKASDDGKYGFSQVTVNVPGSQGSVNPDGTPNVNPVNPNDPDSKVNPGGPGTSVVGTDPVTGNDYIIGVDEDGQLVTTPVPSVIEITELPDKTDYTSGDPVDPSGLVAVLKNNDGTIFTNEDYPDGIIPTSELILPTVIDNSQLYGGGGSFFYTLGLRDLYAEFMTWGTSAFPVENAPVINPNTLPDIHDQIINGWYTRNFGLGTIEEPMGPITNIMYDNYGIIKELAGIDLMTITPSDKSMPVQWKSPYDGRTLETSYEVKLDGSGFSDDSGGSESGGGTDIPGGGSSSDSGGSASGGGGNF